MLWTVEGADKQTGEERFIQVEALTEAAAVEAATGQGLLVSGVLPGGVADVITNYQPTTPPPMDYATAGGRYAVTPDYKMIRVGSTVLKILGIVLFVIAGLIIVGGVIFAGVVFTSRVEQALVILAGSAAYGLAFAVWGFLFMFGSSLSVAIRDSARNSFNR